MAAVAHPPRPDKPGGVRSGCAARCLAGPASAILVVLTAALAASAQEGGGPEPPPFRSLRYEEDYGYLRDPARRADPLDPL